MAAFITTNKSKFQMKFSAPLVAFLLFPLFFTSTLAWAYEGITVADGGTLTGTVKLEGQVPKPKGYNLVTLPDPYYCGRISDGQGWRIL